jgi:vacuolar-type H+-ATPase subunit H
VDIDYLLERLEEALTSGSRIPFSNRSMVDEEECLSILEQIREAVPDEIQRARRINSDRDQLLAEAQEQARHVLAQAAEDSAELVDEHATSRAAEARAIEIRAEAMRSAEEIRREADEFAYAVLERLDRNLSTTLQMVRRGMRELRHGAAPNYEDEAESGAELS